MSRRARILSFGSATSLVIAGAIAGPVVGGDTGELILFLLAGAGFVAATLLAFLEVGLSEDRDRAREQGRADGRQAEGVDRQPPKRPPRGRRPPRHP